MSDLIEDCNFLRDATPTTNLEALAKGVGRRAAARIEELEAVVDMTTNSLYELIKLKEHKNCRGKDAHYLAAQPKAWSEAKKTVEYAAKHATEKPEWK